MQVNRLVNSFYTSNTYLISDAAGEGVWLVDCGDYASQVKTLLDGRKVIGVLLTHTHSDHIYGLVDLLEDFPLAKVFTNDFGIAALGDARLNLSHYHSEVPDLSIKNVKNVISVDEGMEIPLFEDLSASVLATPGHDKSCLSYRIGCHLFTGDSYIPGERLVASFPNSDRTLAKESYNRLLELSKKHIVCPGHGAIASKERGI